jgi:hypothetical protein
MIRFWKIANWIILGIQAVICLLGTFYKHISFGWGLADFLVYIIMYLLFITHLLLTIKLTKQYVFLVFVFIITIIFFCLKATLWRGLEYGWNGEIFYNNP